MPKKYSEKIKSQAKHMYIMEGKSTGEISEVLGPHSTTIDKWVEDEGWDNLRSIKHGSRVAVEISALQQIDMIFQQAASESRILTASETDQLSKLQKLIETTNSDLAFVSNAVEALGQFAEFIHKERADLYDDVGQLVMDFSQKLAKKYTKTGA
jgi:transposase